MELLVAVALVALIMSLFAQAFQIATSLLLRHRGTAENDQRARAVVTMLEADLAKRTYRQRDDALTQRVFAEPNNGLFHDPGALANVANQLGRGIVPLHPDYFLAGIGGKGRGVDGDRERGYFYYSENDPFNDGDDVLQLTVDATITDLGNEDTTPYSGRARLLGFDVDDDGLANLIPSWNAGSPVNVDQPLWDDGIAFNTDSLGNVTTFAPGQDGTSKSRYAEISYFVRNGNLMRRVLLIREPGVSNPPGPIGDEAQPTAQAGVEFIRGNYDLSVDLSPVDINGDGMPDASDFWNDFDYSATRRPLFMRFNVAGNLDNSNVTRAATALGNPRNRFGHDPTPASQQVPLQGRPKEYRAPNNAGTFIGRYTHEETSDSDFLFPGIPGVPRMSPAFTPADNDGDSKVDLFEGGPREGEDILMTNVHAFDVKIWDAAIGDWADVGHTRFTQRDFNQDGDPGAANDIAEFGDWHIGRVLDANLPQGTWEVFDGDGVIFPYQSARRAMYRYGSLDAQTAERMNRVFDTWHPQFNFDALNNLEGQTEQDALDDPPPFRPLWTDRDNFDMQSAGGLAVELMRGQARSTFNRRMAPVVWTPNTAYDTVLPQGGADAYDLDQPPCRVFPFPRQRIEPGQPNAVLYYPGHQSLFYQVVGVSNLGLGPPEVFFSGDSEPAWPIVPGEEVQDGEIRWRAFNNTVGLQAMRITIRFLDPSSGQMRQVTMMHSFVEL